MMIKRVIEIEEDTLKRINEAESVPDMFGTDIVNGLNAIKYSKPYTEPLGDLICRSVLDEIRQLYKDYQPRLATNVYEFGIALKELIDNAPTISPYKAIHDELHKGEEE